MRRATTLWCALALAIIALGVSVSVFADDESLLVNNWTFGSFVVSSRAEYDAWVSKTQDDTIKKLIQQGFSQDQVASVRRQLANQKEEDSLKNTRLSFKRDHSSSAFSEGGGVAGTWKLNGKMLTITWAIPGQDAAVVTSEIVSLSQSQLVWRSHGATTTYISTGK